MLPSALAAEGKRYQGTPTYFKHEREISRNCMFYVECPRSCDVWKLFVAGYLGLFMYQKMYGNIIRLKDPSITLSDVRESL